MEPNTKYETDSVCARFAIVTPMFLGGARHEAESIRPPSVKGALRFWWRALNWGRVRQKTETDESLAGKECKDIAALKQLHDEESWLFGAAAGSEGHSGQGCFLLSVREGECKTEPARGSDSPGVAYLKGMGLKERRAFKSGEEFLIEVLFRAGLNDSVREQIQDALRVFGIAGGLGSRARHGFGSVVKLRANGAHKFRLPNETEVAEDIEWLKSRCTPNNFGLPPFSALSAGFTAGYFGSDQGEYSAVLEEIGRKLNRFRTNGTAAIYRYDEILQQRIIHRQAKIGCRIVEGQDIPDNKLPFLNTDHHPTYVIAKSASIKSKVWAPRRAIFGIPHPYRFNSLQKNVVFDYAPCGQDKPSRRASPLFLHISAYLNKDERKRYRPFLLLLESRFLPLTSVGFHNPGRGPPRVDHRP